MDLSELQQSLEDLVNKAHSLALDSVDGRGDGETRLAAAADLAQKLDQMRLEIDTAPDAERGKLNRAWQTAQSHLQVVVALAPVPPEDTMMGRAMDISERAFSLAKKCAGKQQDSQGLIHQAQALRQEMVSLVGQPGHNAPDVQSLLGEANLDILYVLSGGRAPSSLRLHHFHTAGKL